MEKQGVDRRKRPLGIGLLKNRDQGLGIRDQGAFGLKGALVENTRSLLTKRLVPSPFLCVLFLVFMTLSSPTGLWADEDEIEEYEFEPIEVRVETNPANPTVNNPWSVFILVNHPRTDEVSVESPEFPSSLALERIRTDTRTISSGADNQSERWTRVEFLFTPRRAESIRLEPFEVRIHERFALTEAMNVRVQGESSNRYEPRFRWLAPPAGIRLGEMGEITLELTNWDPARRVPEDFFRGRAPFNAILDENPPERTAATAASAAAVYRYTIFLIPLDHPSVKLEAFSFYSDTYTLSVPEINIPVLPARQVTTASTTAIAGAVSEIDEIQPEDDVPMKHAATLPFPQEREEVFFLWRREYRLVIARVEALWDENRWAEALAVIRKSERDSPVGPSLVSIRREMEDTLGFSVTENERWQPFTVPLFSFAAVGLVLVFTAVFLIILRLRRHENNHFRDDGDKNVTSRRRYGFTVIIVCIFVLGLVFVLPEGSMGIFPAANPVRSGRIAVLKRTQSYRIPDYKGAVNDWFSEGQPATVGDFRGDWCFAETLDGRSGWVERESVINY
jgi:hypothetical protein